MKTLVIDIGGTNVKILATDQAEIRKIPSGPEMTADRMVDAVLAHTLDWEFDRVSIGFPGPVVHGQIVREPRNLAAGWLGREFSAAFKKPVKLINDAAMQALGSYEGGRMLFLGLGTGLGSALIYNRTVASLELAHLPFRKRRTFEDYLGARGLERLGKKKWQRAVEDVVALFRDALVVDQVVLGGGNAKKLIAVPQGARIGDNRNAFLGGFRMWEGYVDA